ncbi:hypothetical protein GHK47_04685 [Sinorhizobium meliloti]|uniref:hypothetical protein n=1 Tax=Rhizobium meliloti TaxID=382 RepID=UPI001296EA6E|nr:hypothetical protein [Sinorhizobium meliloti]
MQSTDERLDGHPAERAAEGSSSMQKDLPERHIDPSESVTLFAIALGAIGALVGLIAGIIFLAGSSVGSAVLNCLIAVLAGGSAGVVAGGTLGAALVVFRGVRAPKEHGQ